MLSKAQLRQAFRSNLERLQEPAVHASESERVVHQLVEFLKDKSGLWAGFQPIGFEADIREVFARVTHVQWVFPKVVGEHLEFYKISDVSQLIKNQWQIPEPDPARGLERVELSRCEGVLVPGLAFDLTGHRLGRGKGYYDRALSSYASNGSSQGNNRQLIKVGVALEKQISSVELPFDRHDIAMDWLVTESKSIATKGLQS